MQINVKTVRGLALGDGAPKICVPVTAADFGELERQARAAAESPCDMVEWRADYFEEREDPAWPERVLEMLRLLLGGRPVLFTFRTKEEGGARSAGMETYESLCVRAAKSRLADLVDVELNRGEERLCRLTEQIHAHGGLVVASYHDFGGTPPCDEIVAVLRRMQELGADITKAAVMPRSEEDVLELLQASVQMKNTCADRPFITMSMGGAGAVSRLAGALTGSAVTFATAGRASAPGQMDAEFVARALRILQN